ncbi:MAG: hypothetical protein Q9222_004573 [Ikaeria aurantiellina]
MLSEILPPNPCLLAILLVAKVNSEPQLVFHYPPRPGEDNSHFARYLAAQEKEQDGSSSTDDDSTSSHDDEAASENKAKETKTGTSTPEFDVEEVGSASPEKNDVWKNQYGKPKWNDIFGLRALGLARMLCPPSTSHKQKFELSIDDKVFVGRPIFAQEGEEWERKKEERRARARKSNTEDTVSGVLEKENEGPTHPTEQGQISRIDGELPEEAISDSNEDRPSISAANPPLPEKQVKTVKKPALNMFHVVFVVNPPPHEYHLRVKEMYDHVIRKLSKALRREQARSNYVLREISAIAKGSVNLKKAHKDDQPLASLYHGILSQSTLAKAISVVYNNISASRIAHIILTPSSSLSFQIPIPTSISVLPSPLSPQMPGLWLTTATSLPADDDISLTSTHLASQFTLLLLLDLTTILSEINDTPSPLSAPLAHYLRVSKPTKSFLQISQSSGIPLPDIQFLASHLIYWRKARAIPPLHQRDTYIVSPNADMSKLVSASTRFAKMFPALPPLPKILNLLSSPRAYSTLIPSKDHKEAFMKILAWLLRDGWVTQLRTFMWVRVPPHIKEIVAGQGGEGERSLESSIELPPKKHIEDDEKAHSKSTTTNLAAPQPSSSPTLSATSQQTTIPFRTSAAPPSPSLILNPRQASGINSRYLSAISVYILQRQGVEAQKAWNKCLRYFDGKHAVEGIAVQEGWKRKRVVEFLAGWEGEGVLVRGRWW